jgi:hypothetical protein
MGASSGDQSGGNAAKPKPLICIECGKPARGRAVGFRAYVSDEDKVVVYCYSWAKREFGADEDDLLIP